MRHFLKNKFHFILAFILASSIAGAATYFDDLRSLTLGVGTDDIHASNIFEVVSTTKASKPCPVMTEVQRDAIGSPQVGACVLNSTSGVLNYYNGSTWGPISNPASVLGPVSSVDNSIARFDGTTGKLIQGSPLVISDTGGISSTLSNQDITIEPNGSGSITSTKKITAGNLQSNGHLVVTGEWQGVSTAYTNSGTNAALANPPALVVSLTNSSLVSIGNISTGISTFAIFINNTGNTILVTENASGTASHRIITGTGGDVEIENGASFLATYLSGVDRWFLVGGTGTGGGGTSPQQFTTKNSYNFEANVGGWVLYNDSSSSAVDCTGGTSSGDFLFSRETSAPLVGRGSGYINALNLANTQGEGVSLDVAIPAVYRGRNLSLEFDYYGFGSYASNDFKVFAYDVTNSALLNNGAAYEGTPISSGYGKFSANIFPNSNSATIRICIHNATTATTLKNLHFDEVRLKLTDGTSVPLIQTFKTVPVLNGFGTVTNTDFDWTIVGDRLVGTGRYQVGTPTGSNAQLILPNGFTHKSNLAKIVGRWYRNNSSASTLKSGTLAALANSSTLTFGVDVYSITTSPFSVYNGNELSSASEVMTVEFDIPITQLSQNTIQTYVNQANLYDTTKFLSSSITSNTTNVASLAFSDLVVGRKYVAELSIFSQSTGANFLSLTAVHNGSTIGVVENTGSGTASNNSIRSTRTSPSFIATATTMTVNATVNSSGTINGTGTATGSYVTVREVPSVNYALVTRQMRALEPRSDGTVYQAQTDGFFIGTISSTASSGNKVARISGFVGDTNTPTTLLGAAFIYGHSNANLSNGERDSFTIPVKAGEYYQGIFLSSVGDATGLTVTYSWRPFGW